MDLAPECVAMDVQGVGGFALVAFGSLQHPTDEPLLKLRARISKHNSLVNHLVD